MRRSSTLLLLAVLTLAGASRAVASTKLVAAAPSALELAGTSNVTDWRCRGTSLQTAMEVAEPVEKINTVIDRIEDGNIGVWKGDVSSGSIAAPTFQMEIPIASLRCGNKVMERDMNRALKAEQHPTINFRFKELRGPVRHDIDTNVFRAQIAGELVLAGKRREILVNVNAERVTRERFRLRAEMPLRMTDFGITPPTAMFGMVKAADELTVKFDLMMEAGR